MRHVIVRPWRPRSRVSLGVNSKKRTFQSDSAPGLLLLCCCIQSSGRTAACTSCNIRRRGLEPGLDDACPLQQPLPLSLLTTPGHRPRPLPLGLLDLGLTQVVDVTEPVGVGLVHRVGEGGSKVALSDV